MNFNEWLLPHDEMLTPTMLTALRKLVQPCIAVDLTLREESEIELGASKIGGLPDVPTDFEWPQDSGWPMQFVAQVDLREVAAFDVQKQLPGAGLLSFWSVYEFNSVWGTLFFWPNAENLQRVASPPLPRRIQKDMALYELKSARLTFASSFSLPDFESEEATKLFEQFSNDETLSKWLDIVADERSWQEGKHQLLGVAIPIQGSSLVIAAQEQGLYGAAADEFAKQWQLLFQCDYDSRINAQWGDCGTQYYSIRHADLKARDFSSVLISNQCH